ncbi:helix-turn-helix domain-containing protein [Amycolatopsis kentuckyensis]|uniref:helix-turn-helix domain-containing protein n=1 Tax=Amycolatopsis kentuckyensis TaxID=218823 RepID=UPI0035648E62
MFTRCSTCRTLSVRRRRSAGTGARVANASIDVIALHGALDAAREARELSWRQLAKLLDVSPSTMSRLANGRTRTSTRSPRWCGGSMCRRRSS